jgi:hypothetical protein
MRKRRAGHYMAPAGRKAASADQEYNACFYNEITPALFTKREK